MTTLPERARRRDLRQLLGDNPAVVLTFVFVGIFVATDIVNRSQSGQAFLTPKQVSTTFLYAAVLGLIAAGQTLVMLTAGVDLSVATTATAAAFFVSKLGSHGAAVAIAVALGIGLGIGIVNGIGIAIFRVNALIMTLGVSVITLGVLTVEAQKQFTRQRLIERGDANHVHQERAMRLHGRLPRDRPQTFERSVRPRCVPSTHRSLGPQQHDLVYTYFRELLDRPRQPVSLGRRDGHGDPRRRARFVGHLIDRDRAVLFGQQAADARPSTAVCQRDEIARPCAQRSEQMANVLGSQRHRGRFEHVDEDVRDGAPLVRVQAHHCSSFRTLADRLSPFAVCSPRTSASRSSSWRSSLDLGFGVSTSTVT